jgi:transposase
MIGVDLAKNIMQLHAVDARGRVVFRKRLARNKLLDFLAGIPACIVAMEACSGAHYWGREIALRGHCVRLVSPQYVKPFVKTNKNDARDAEAICEAASRPSMRFVPLKTAEQLDLQAMHRIRSGCIKRRTALGNEIRGHLAEYGLVLPTGLAKLRAGLPHLLETEAGLTLQARDCLSDLFAELIALDERVAKYDRRLLEFAKNDEDCRRLMTIPGIGVITATIIRAVAGDGRQFANGRHFAAWLGLVPRQHSSGGRERLGRISKRGDRYVRTQLVQGAHNIVRRAADDWLAGVRERRGYNRACVAQANKTARVAWAVLTKKEAYKAA